MRDSNAFSVGLRVNEHNSKEKTLGALPGIKFIASGGVDIFTDCRSTGRRVEKTIRSLRGCPDLPGAGGPLA